MFVPFRGTDRRWNKYSALLQSVKTVAQPHHGGVCDSFRRGGTFFRTDVAFFPSVHGIGPAYAVKVRERSGRTWRDGEVRTR